MHKLKINKDIDSCLELLKANASTTGEGKLFKGSFDGDDFSLTLMRGRKDGFQPIAKGKVLDSENGDTCQIHVAFNMNARFIVLMLGLMAFMMLFAYVLQFVIPYGDMLYTVYVLAVSVVVIFGVLSFNYQINKMLNTLEEVGNR